MKAKTNCGPINRLKMCKRALTRVAFVMRACFWRLLGAQARRRIREKNRAYHASETSVQQLGHDDHDVAVGDYVVFFYTLGAFFCLIRDHSRERPPCSFPVSGIRSVSMLRHESAMGWLAALHKANRLRGFCR